jgi:integrase
LNAARAILCAPLPGCIPPTPGCPRIVVEFSHLAVGRNVSASTQNQALSAILFLYRDVLGDEVPWISNLVRAARSRRLPTVLTAEEVRRLIAGMTGVRQLVARLLYGTGMRLLEGLRVRVKDVDFGASELLVRNGKGDKDRTTMLPRSLAGPLQEQMRAGRALHDRDVEEGYGRVWMPEALA